MFELSSELARRSKRRRLFSLIKLRFLRINSRMAAILTGLCRKRLRLSRCCLTSGQTSRRCLLSWSPRPQAHIGSRGAYRTRNGPCPVSTWFSAPWNIEKRFRTACRAASVGQSWRTGSSMAILTSSSSGYSRTAAANCAFQTAAGIQVQTGSSSSPRAASRSAMSLLTTPLWLLHQKRLTKIPFVRRSPI
jgi:hypothetical protein